MAGLKANCNQHKMPGDDFVSLLSPAAENTQKICRNYERRYFFIAFSFLIL
jgi:hypothetical protein